jgi:hypothetical protein
VATIRELYVKMGVDASAVSSGLARTTAEMTRFSDNALQIADKISGAVESGLRVRSGGQVITKNAASAVNQLVRQLTVSFENRKAEIEQAVSVGLMSDQAAALAGRKAANAYATGLQTGLRSLTTQGVLKPGQGGQFLDAAAVTRETEQVAQAGAGLSRRMASVSVGVLFAFDAMTRGAAAGEGAWRRVLRSMGIMAAVTFDPPAGLIVAGLLAATDVIVEAFQRQEKAAEAARRKFQETAIDIARSYDIMRAAQQKQFAFSGDPFARRGVGTNMLTGQQVPADETAEAFNARRNGLIGLQKEQAQLIAQGARVVDSAKDIQSAFGSLGTGAGGSMAQVVRTMTPLDQKLQEVNALMKQQVQFNTEAGATFEDVQRHTAEIAGNILRIWQDTKLPKDVANEAERLLSIYDLLNKQHQATVPLAQAVLDAYDKVTKQLRKLHDEGKTAFDPLVEGLLRAQATLEKSPLVEMLRLGRIPSAGAVAQTPTIPQGLSLPPGIGAAEFAANVPIQEAERIREVLAKALATGSIQPTMGFGGAPLSVAPAGGAITQTQVIMQTIKDRISDTLTGFGNTLSATLMTSFGPIAILMRAMEPAIRTLTPLFDRLAVPIAIVAQVLVASLLPIFRALYPILRAFGVAATLVGEVMARIAAAIAQAVGGLIKAIGNLIARIPGLGGVGHAIANFGQSILNFAAGQKAAADQFAQARKQLENMSWDDTAQALDNLQGAAQNAADALSNIPQGFRIQRAIFLASRPVNAADVGAGPNSSAGSGASNYFAPGSIVIVGSTKSGAQLLDEVSRAARQTAMARTGTTADAASVIG